MISRIQMKIDLVGQAILLLIYILLLVFSRSPWESADWGLGILLLWQAASAALLWRAYRYRQRGPVFWVLLVLLSSIFFIELSMISSLLLSVPVLAYLILTLRDTLRVYRRPRSFWDIG